MWQRLKGLFVATKVVEIKDNAKQSEIDIDINKKQCQICLERKEEQKFISLCSCFHKFCDQCAQQHVKTKLKDYELINCPFEECNTYINQEGQIYKIKFQKIHQQYQKIKRYHFVSKNPQFKLCPKDECEGIIKIQPLTAAFCKVCQQKYCPKCLYKEHKGKCDEKSILHLQQDLQFIQCIKCDFIIEKNKGCDHIKCLCGFQLCYKCGGLWTGAQHLCYRSKRFQKVRKTCLILQQKFKLGFKTSKFSVLIKNIHNLTKNLLFVNLALTIIITLFQILFNLFTFITSILFSIADDDKIPNQQSNKLDFNFIWPYLYFLSSLAFGFCSVYFNGKLRTQKGRINFVLIILITIVTYFFLPNLLYIFYYEAIFILFLIDHFTIIFILLSALYIINKTYPSYIPTREDIIESLKTLLNSALALRKRISF